MSTGAPTFPRRNFRRRRGAFTLLEILLALALVGLILVALNTFVFSMGELWGKNSDVRLFELHVRSVTRFLEEQLRTAALPPFARSGSTPVVGQEIRPQSGASDTMLTVELTAGNRLFVWPDRPLPEVVCSLQARDREGLILLWHSRLEKNFDTDPPREIVLTPFVTAMSYDYFDTDFKKWTTETTLRKDKNSQTLVPQRLRLKFVYGKLTRESLVSLPTSQQGLPNF